MNELQSSNLEYMVGRVLRTIYRAPDDYTVFILDTEDGNVTVVGAFPELQAGDELKVGGTWFDHPRYGRQFRAETFSAVLPDTEEGIAAYLASGLIQGVGPTIAQRIVAAFGTDTLRVLEEHSQRLLEIEGIAEKKKAQILASFEETRHLQKTISRLQEHGLSLNLAMKLYREYGDEAPDVIEENPYRLTTEVWGVGFKTADGIARTLGIRRNSPVRLGAVLQYVLGEAANRDGHVFMAASQLIEQAVQLLDPIEAWEAEELAESMRGILLMLAARGDVIVEGDNAYLRNLHRAEEATADHLARLIREGPHLRLQTAEADRHIDDVERLTGIVLADEQREAVKSVLTRPVTVITGGPGTGKTTIVQTAIESLRKLNPDTTVLLAAPTGRAAQRLAEVTGLEARTIHRLLEYTFAEGRPFFARDEHSPLEGDLLIIDESSMIDAHLAYALLRAVPDGMRVAFVGDADQLPPVGPGDFLRQLIESSVVPVVRLTRIFRQHEASDIVIHAHQINRGERPNYRNSRDVEFIRAETAETVAEQVEQLVSRLFVPAAGGSSPSLWNWQSDDTRQTGSPTADTTARGETRGDELDELQVISPMHRGSAGVAALNQRLQAVLNPPAEGEAQLSRGAVRFRQGDRVMCMRNNYQKGQNGIFNGNIGRVERVVTADESDSETGQLAINFDGEVVVYNQSELDELALAYATTVHKAQGSEFPTVILVVATQHYIMLHRNLLYTGYTRARKKLYVVGSPRALHIAIRNNRMRERNTQLAERLLEKVEGR